MDIPLFALPGSLLLQVPVIGPLSFIIVQASAAFAVDRLAHPQAGQPVPAAALPLHAGTGRLQADRLPTPAPPTLPAGPVPAAEQGAVGPSPTLPAGPMPLISTKND